MAEQPSRKRWNARRAAILIMVSVLIVGVVWRLTRPQLDPRLVGKWGFEMNGQMTTGNYEYRDDGTGEFWRSGIPPTPLSWQVSGNRLIVERRLNLQTRVQNAYDSLRSSLTGRQPKREWGDNVEIVQISQDDILLLDVSFWPMKVPVRLRRLKDDPSETISD